MHECIHVCVQVHQCNMYGYIYVCIHACVFVPVYVCLCVLVCACVYVVELLSSYVLGLTITGL